MKKIIAMLLALVMILGLAACSQTETPAGTTEPKPSATTPATTEAPETTEPALDLSALPLVEPGSVTMTIGVQQNATVLGYVDNYFTKYIEERGLGLINASILYMGMLTKDVKTLVHWRDKQLIQDIRKAVIKANELCDAAGTSLPEQACLFGLGYQEPASTLIGMGRPSSLERNLKLLEKPRNLELEAQLLELFKGLSLFQDIGQINGKTIVGSYSDRKDN